MATANDIRRGMAINYNGDIAVVLDSQHRTPGNLRAFVQDKAVQIDLPSSVVLTVKEAPDGIRGDSANNVQKPVILETGITVQVPLFIKTGEKLKIDTRTGKYLERA